MRHLLGFGTSDVLIVISTIMLCFSIYYGLEYAVPEEATCENMIMLIIRVALFCGGLGCYCILQVSKEEYVEAFVFGTFVFLLQVSMIPTHFMQREDDLMFPIMQIISQFAVFLLTGFPLFVIIFFACSCIISVSVMSWVKIFTSLEPALGASVFCVNIAIFLLVVLAGLAVYYRVYRLANDFILSEADPYASCQLLPYLSLMEAQAVRNSFGGGGPSNSKGTGCSHPWPTTLGGGLGRISSSSSSSKGKEEFINSAIHDGLLCSRSSYSGDVAGGGELEVGRQVALPFWSDEDSSHHHPTTMTTTTTSKNNCNLHRMYRHKNSFPPSSYGANRLSFSSVTPLATTASMETLQQQDTDTSSNVKVVDVTTATDNFIYDSTLPHSHIQTSGMWQQSPTDTADSKSDLQGYGGATTTEEKGRLRTATTISRGNSDRPIATMREKAVKMEYSSEQPSYTTTASHYQRQTTNINSSSIDRYVQSPHSSLPSADGGDSSDHNYSDTTRRESPESNDLPFFPYNKFLHSSSSATDRIINPRNVSFYSDSPSRKTFSSARKIHPSHFIPLTSSLSSSSSLCPRGRDHCSIEQRHHNKSEDFLVADPSLPSPVIDYAVGLSPLLRLSISSTVPITPLSPSISSLLDETLDKPFSKKVTSITSNETLRWERETRMTRDLQSPWVNRAKQLFPNDSPSLQSISNTRFSNEASSSSYGLCPYRCCQSTLPTLLTSQVSPAPLRTTTTTKIENIFPLSPETLSHLEKTPQGASLKFHATDHRLPSHTSTFLPSAASTKSLVHLDNSHLLRQDPQLTTQSCLHFPSRRHSQPSPLHPSSGARKKSSCVCSRFFQGGGNDCCSTIRNHSVSLGSGRRNGGTLKQCQFLGKRKKSDDSAALRSCLNCRWVNRMMKVWETTIAAGGDQESCASVISEARHSSLNEIPAEELPSHHTYSFCLPKASYRNGSLRRTSVEDLPLPPPSLVRVFVNRISKSATNQVHSDLRSYRRIKTLGTRRKHNSTFRRLTSGATICRSMTKTLQTPKMSSTPSIVLRKKAEKQRLAACIGGLWSLLKQMWLIFTSSKVVLDAASFHHRPILPEQYAWMRFKDEQIERWFLDWLRGMSAKSYGMLAAWQLVASVVNVIMSTALYLWITWKRPDLAESVFPFCFSASVGRISLSFALEVALTLPMFFIKSFECIHWTTVLSVTLTFVRCGFASGDFGVRIAANIHDDLVVLGPIIINLAVAPVLMRLNTIIIRGIYAFFFVVLNVLFFVCAANSSNGIGNRDVALWGRMIVAYFGTFLFMVVLFSRAEEDAHRLRFSLIVLPYLFQLHKMTHLYDDTYPCDSLHDPVPLSTNFLDQASLLRREGQNYSSCSIHSGSGIKSLKPLWKPSDPRRELITVRNTTSIANLHGTSSSTIRRRYTCGSIPLHVPHPHAGRVGALSPKSVGLSPTLNAGGNINNFRSSGKVVAFASSVSRPNFSRLHTYDGISIVRNASTLLDSSETFEGEGENAIFDDTWTEPPVTPEYRRWWPDDPPMMSLPPPSYKSIYKGQILPIFKRRPDAESSPPAEVGHKDSQPLQKEEQEFHAHDVGSNTVLPTEVLSDCSNGDVVLQVPDEMLISRNTNVDTPVSVKGNMRDVYSHPLGNSAVSIRSRKLSTLSNSRSPVRSMRCDESFGLCSRDSWNLGLHHDSVNIKQTCEEIVNQCISGFPSSPVSARNRTQLRNHGQKSFFPSPFPESSKSPISSKISSVPPDFWYKSPNDLHPDLNKCYKKTRRTICLGAEMSNENHFEGSQAGGTQFVKTQRSPRRSTSTSPGHTCFAVEPSDPFVKYKIYASGIDKILRGGKRIEE